MVLEENKMRNFFFDIGVLLLYNSIVYVFICYHIVLECNNLAIPRKKNYWQNKAICKYLLFGPNFFSKFCFKNEKAT